MSQGLMLAFVAVFMMVFFYNAYTFWLISHISRRYPLICRELKLPESFLDVMPKKAFNLFRFLALPARVELAPGLKRLILAWRFMFACAILGFLVVIVMAFMAVNSQQI
ncbi:hypothetical protein GW916_04285 [bacterium]|nr:hypothetical protein [bacterium]